MMTRNSRIPKRGEQVRAEGQYGVFVVIKVHVSARTADLQILNRNLPIQKSVPWSVLRYGSKKTIQAGFSKALVRTPRTHYKALT